MKHSHLSRAITLVLALALLLLPGAWLYPTTTPPQEVSPPPPPPPAPPTAARCAGDNLDRGAPVICVDADKAGFPPDPYVAEVWDVEKGGNGKPDPNRPVRVQWVASRGETLRVEFMPDPAGEQCVTRQPNCAQSQCTAVVQKLREVNGERQSRSCKYHVWIDDRMGEATSPELRVNPCCW